MKVVLGCFFALVSVHSGLAWACEGPPVPLSRPFVVNPGQDPGDTEAPGKLTIDDWTVEREENDDEYSSSCGQAGCSPEASVGFHILPLEEDPNQVHLGYLVKHVAPSTGNCYPCDEPLIIEDGWIWVGVHYTAGEDIEHTFEIHAVDEAGNVGPGAMVEVVDPASGGCASALGGHGCLFGLVMLVLAAGWRKRRKTV